MIFTTQRRSLSQRFWVYNISKSCLFVCIVLFDKFISVCVQSIDISTVALNMQTICDPKHATTSNIQSFIFFEFERICGLELQ